MSLDWTLSLKLSVGLILFAGFSQPSAQAQSKGATDNSTPGEIKVKLLDAGQEPKTRLRYRFEFPSKEVFQMTMGISLGLRLGKQTQPLVRFPKILTTFALQGAARTAEGSLKYDFEIVDSVVFADEGCAKDLVAAMQAETANIKGLRGWAQVSDRGLTQQALFHTPKDASPQLIEILEHMQRQIHSISSPFPEEPIGKGAIWEVTWNHSIRSIEVVQKATYQLIELEDLGGKTEFKLTQQAQPQTIQVPGMPKETIVKLQQLYSEGEGSVAFKLNRVTPTSRASLGMKMQLQVLVDQQDESMEMEMKIDMNTAPQPQETLKPEQSRSE